MTQKILFHIIKSISSGNKILHISCISLFKIKIIFTGKIELIQDNNFNISPKLELKNITSRKF